MPSIWSSVVSSSLITRPEARKRRLPRQPWLLDADRPLGRVGESLQERTETSNTPIDPGKNRTYHWMDAQDRYGVHGAVWRSWPWE